MTAGDDWEEWDYGEADDPRPDDDDPYLEDERMEGTATCPGTCDPLCLWCSVDHNCPEDCGGGADCPYLGLPYGGRSPKPDGWRNALSVFAPPELVIDPTIGA